MAEVSFLPSASIRKRASAGRERSSARAVTLFNMTARSMHAFLLLYNNNNDDNNCNNNNDNNMISPDLPLYSLCFENGATRTPKRWPLTSLFAFFMFLKVIIDQYSELYKKNLA